MAITFPSNPLDGELFTANEVDNKQTYIYQASKERWRLRKDSDLLFVSGPTINSPEDGYNYASLTLTLTSSDYYPNANTGPHQYSQWQISSDNGFNNLVYDTGEVSYLTSFTVPSNYLNYGTTYYARVRYFSEVTGGLGRAVSNWSETKTFRTDVNPGSTWQQINNLTLSTQLDYTASNYRITTSLAKEIVVASETLSNVNGIHLNTYLSVDNGNSWDVSFVAFSNSSNYGGYIYKYIWNGYRWYIIYGKGYSTRGINYINGTDNNIGYYSLWTHNWTYTTTFLDAVWNGLEFICASAMVSGGYDLYLSRHTVNAEGNFNNTPQNTLYLDGSGVGDPRTEDTGYPVLCYLDETLEPSSSYTYRYHLAWTTSAYAIRYRTGLSDAKTEYNNVLSNRVTGAAYLKLYRNGFVSWYFYIIRTNGKINRFKLDASGNFTSFNNGEFPEGPTGSYYQDVTNHQVPTETTQDLNSIAVKQGVCAIIVGDNKTILKTNVEPVGDGLTNPGAWAIKYDTTLFADTNYNKVVYNAEYDVWVIVGNNGVVLTSTDDGETWNVKSSGVLENLRDVLWTGDYFFASGHGLVLKS